MSYELEWRLEQDGRKYMAEAFKENYDLGYNAAKDGKKYKNPHKPSGHERDTTYDDEMNFWYYCGYYDFFKKE